MPPIHRPSPNTATSVRCRRGRRWWPVSCSRKRSPIRDADRYPWQHRCQRVVPRQGGGDGRESAAWRLRCTSARAVQLHAPPTGLTWPGSGTSVMCAYVRATGTATDARHASPPSPAPAPSILPLLPLLFPQRSGPPSVSPARSDRPASVLVARDRPCTCPRHTSGGGYAPSVSPSAAPVPRRFARSRASRRVCASLKRRVSAGLDGTTCRT